MEPEVAGSSPVRHQNVDVAQQVEHQIEDLGRAGSIPVIHTNYDFVAQLVQSTPLLMEGSWVRAPPGSLCR